MTELTPQYQVNPHPPVEMAVTKTYSLTFAHIAKVSDLAQRLGISQGEIVRRAIDLLYQKIDRIEAREIGDE
jgi:hypothetical protein